MVTRIIAGFAGSLALTVPGSGTRPTSDRVREAIFSALESRNALRGARVVDLYAGSGALGLEAASRGAASVTLVENSSAAVRACRDNAARVLRNAPEGTAPDVAAPVITGPVITVAAQAVATFLGSSVAEWDLALIDPPYEVGNIELAVALAALAPRLAPDAILLLERATRSGEPSWPSGLTLNRSRAYGDTTLWWASVG